MRVRTSWSGAAARGVAVLGAALLYAPAAYADDLADLRNLSLEELANLEVTSVSRRPAPLSRAPAAIEVITAEDIRRSGALSLAEALRLARNLQVARIDAQYHAISARGFNSFQASNKLLVLIDGRSIYTPLYSGVLWDAHDTPLQDIERIEVISGPGGALWGANAVNGVINIITRSADATQGFSADLYGGTLDQRADLRYGGQLGDVHYRIWATGFSRGDMELPSGGPAGDDWSMAQVGFRADWSGAQDALMLQGAARERTDGDGDNSGGHVLLSWQRDLDDGSNLQIQTYVSRAAAGVGPLNDELVTYDIEAQHAMRIGERHSIVWGGGYRLSESEFNSGNPGSGLVEPRRTLRTASFFVQDEIALRPDLSLTLGLKLEDHTFTELEYMPSVRLAWRPSDNTLLWAAVSRAVRTPSRIDRELVVPGMIVPGFFESEYMTAYELGYRVQPSARASLSINLYYHDYDGVRTINLTPPGALPFFYGNGLDGPVYGAEIWSDYDISDDWRVSAGLTLLESDLDTAPLSIDINGTGLDPNYQFFLRSRHDLAEDWTFDLDLRAIDSVSADIPAYAELGMRLAWRVSDNVELSLAGHNLLDPSHPESADGPIVEVPRSIQLGARLTY